MKTRRGVLATGFRPAPRILPIVSSENTSRGFMQRRRPYRIGDIGDIGAAFCDRTVAITTITIGWLMTIGHISTKRRLGERPLLPGNDSRRSGSSWPHLARMTCE